MFPGRQEDGPKGVVGSVDTRCLECRGLQHRLVHIQVGIDCRVGFLPALRSFSANVVDRYVIWFISERVCDFDAIVMNEQELPVVIEDKCTACNDCVEICPKDLFSIHPVSHRLWVACKNLEFGDDILDECQVGCTACGRCAMDAPGKLIAMQDNLPVIDYERNHKTQEPIQRCPTGAIVWIDPKAGIVKGPAAKKIIRKGARMDAPT